ncbi:hypothetical protein [Moraxella lacunata]|uniref:hypothetical protein n=1 Tax=Moraxella lacunata TaxID=477 RepID=UPI003EDF47B3
MPFATIYSWLPLMASVDLSEISPAATCLIWRSLLASPTDTEPFSVEPTPEKSP